MHHYRRNLGDYAKKTGRLSMLEHGAYNLLIDACYDRERFPTRDEAIDWTWASTTEEIEAVDFILNRFFSLQEDGTYTQKRIAEEVASYHDHCNKQQENGKKGGRPKKPKPSDKKPIGFSEEPKGKPEVASGLPEKPKKTLTNNQLTNNQEPIENSVEPDGSTPLGSEGEDSEDSPPSQPHRFVAADAELPDEVDREVWRQWCAFRSKRRKPVSEDAARLQLKLLCRYPRETQQEIVNHSIQNDYQGLFEPKRGARENSQPASNGSSKPLSAVDRVRIATGQ